MTSQERNPTVPRHRETASEPNPRRDWRVSYASAVLIGVLVLGFLVLTPNIYFQSTPWLTLVFFAAYAATGAAVAWRGSVPLKIALSVAVLGASGIAAILGGASPANGTFFLVALVTVVTLLESPRSGAIATAVTLVVVALVATLSGAGLLGVASRDSTLHAPAAWIGAALAVLLFGAALVLGIGHLQRNAGRTQDVEMLSSVEGPHAGTPAAAQTSADRSEWLHKALETGRKLNSLPESADPASGLMTAVREVFGYPQVALFLVNADGDGLVRARLAADEAASEEQPPLAADSLAAQAIQSGLAQISSIQSKEGEGIGGPTLTTEAAIPISREGEALGALQVQTLDSRGFEEDEIEALGWVAAQAAALLPLHRVRESAALYPGPPESAPQRLLTHPWERTMGDESIEYEFGDRELPASSPEIRVPLSLRDEEIGTISLAADADWSAEERSLVEAVATQAALALENARLMEASQLAALREHTLAEITAKVWGAATLEGVLRTAVQELAQAFAADRAIIELRAETDDDR
jgi:GAF domain-containing protein